MTQISAGPRSQLVIAPFINRLGAYVVDGLVLVALLVPVSLLAAAMPAGIGLAASTLLPLAWPVAWLRACSATPGKLLCRMLVQPVSAPGRLRWSTIAVRVGVTSVLPGFCGWLALLVIGPANAVVAAGDAVSLTLGWLLVDCLSSLGNPQRQTIHDRVAGTLVLQQVTTWPAPPPAPVPDGAMTNTMPPPPPAPGR